MEVAAKEIRDKFADCSSTSGDDSIYYGNKHAETVLQAINNLRLRGEFCDVVIKVEETEFSCHKCVLVASTPYFATMFQDHFIESQQNSIQMYGFDSDSMKSALQYIYTGHIDFTEKRARNLVHAGEFLGIVTLRNEACDFLKTVLNADNCLGLYYLAQNYGYSDLQKNSYRFIMRHFEDVCLSEEFLDLTEEQLVAIVKQDSLQVKNEQIVFSAVLRWCSERPERFCNLPAVMENVRLLLLDSEFFRDCTVLFPQLKQLPEVMEIIDRANLVFSSPFRDLTWSHAQLKPRVDSEVSIIIVAGGWQVEGEVQAKRDVRTVKCYRPLTRQWLNLKSLPIACKEFAVVPLRNGFFVSGGNYRSGRVQRYGCIYDVDSAKWSNSGPLCGQLTDAGYVELNNWLYIVGGMTLEGVENNITQFDPASTEQFVAGTLTIPVWRSAVVTYDGMIYSAGGLSSEDSGPRSLQRFDPDTGRCELLSPLLTGRSGAGACVLHNFIYLIGGKDGELYLNLVECYSINDDRWEFVSPMKFPRHRPGVAVVDERIYVVGGEIEPNTYTYTIECYHPPTNQWETVSALPFPLSAFGCAAFKVKQSAFVSEEEATEVPPEGRILSHNTGFFQLAHFRLMQF